MLIGTSVLANDAGVGLHVTSNTSPAHGSVVVSPDGTYTYTPTSGYSGPDSFTYTSSDSSGHSSTATVSITIAPTSADDSGTTVAGTTLNGASVLTNDAGSLLTVTAHTSPSHGTVTILSDGTYIYIPTTGYSGPDSFDYTATDATGQTTTATVNLTVTPLVTNNSATTSTNTAVNSTSVLGNDSGTGLTISGHTSPTHGTLVFALDGSYTYTPTTGYSGPDSFDYTATDATGQSATATVSLTILPTAIVDSATTPANTALVGTTLLANDAGSGLAVFSATAPLHGSVVVRTDGTYTYTPTAGYSGPDSFTYTVTDLSGQTATATVTVNVTPTAFNNTATTPADTTLNAPSVLTNDVGSTLTAAVATPPLHGTLAMNPDGTYTYTPTAGYSGPDSFTYTATDASGGASTATVTVSVTPTAVADSATVTSGSSLTGVSALGNDSGTSLTVTAHTNTSHGVVVIHADGTYTYTPGAGYSGPDAFTYTVTDASGQTATATVNLTVVPQAAADSNTTAANVAVSGSVLANDLGSGLTVTSNTAPLHGTVIVLANGTYTYTPAANYSGPDEFTYITTDANGQTTAATVTMTVTPVASDDTAGTSVNTTINGASVLSNDAGSGLTVTGHTDPTHGTLTMNSDGTYVYIPTSGFSGSDSFAYTTTDATGQTATATVALGIGIAALPDTGSTSANTPLNGASVLGNDLGTGLIVVSSTAPSHGTLTMHPDGTYRYTPTTGYSGPDSFTYTTNDTVGHTGTATVTLAVLPAAASEAASVVAGSTLVAPTVLSNDAGTSLTVTGYTPVAHGTLTVNTDGTYTYSPTPGYSGLDQFTYTVTDASGQTATATVTLTVTPKAVGDSGTTSTNTPLNGTTVLTNDAGTGLNVTSNSSPAHGTLTIASDGTYTYTPTTGYSGPDSFTYTATDANGQTTIGVVAIAVTPTATPDTYSTAVGVPITGSTLLANDLGSGLSVTAHSNPTHGTLSLASNGTFTYTPTAGYSGPDSFTYTVTDTTGQMSTATVTLSVGAVAVNDTGIVASGGVLNGTTLLGNDSGVGLTVTSNTSPTHGTVTVNTDGTYVYTSTAGFSGPDTFTYTATDSSGLTSIATVTINVTPVAIADTANAVSGVATSGTSVLTNDRGVGLTIASYSAPAHGTLLMQPNGTYLYTPTIGFSGNDTFTYTAIDASGRTSTATVTIAVSPVAVNDVVTAIAGQPLIGTSLLTNDVGVGLTVTSNTSPAHGVVAINPDGTFTYTADTGYSGPDTFSYTVTDATGHTSTGTVSVTVNPKAVGDSATAVANTPFTGASVLTNDLGTSLTVTSSTNPTHGTVTVNTDGTYLYTPFNGFSGADAFTYTATDASGGTTTAVVSLTVAPKAIDDIATITSGSPLTINVTANDFGVGLTVTSVTQPTAGLGTVAIVGGQVVFTAATGTSGPVVFTYTTTDAAGHTSTASVTVNVTPKAVTDPAFTPVNTILHGTSVLTNDLGTGLTVTAKSNPSHGVLTMSPDGTYTYVPSPGYSGADAFTYTAVDVFGQTTVGSVSIAVGTAAVPDFGTTPSGIVLNGTTLLANDGGTGITVTANTQPAHGTVIVQTDGTYIYTPAAGYSGPDSFTYTITDTSGQTATSSASIAVTPVAHDDLLTTAAGTTVHGATVMANDSGTGLTVAVGSLPTHGSLNLNADGTYMYTPTAGYSGPDSFTYVATDAAGQTSTATVTIVVNPAATNDTATVAAGGVLTGSSVLTNDSGSGLTVTASTQPSHGVLTMNPDGTYVYTPTPGYSGADTFAYTAIDLSGHSVTGSVTVTVQPKAVADVVTLPSTGTFTGPSLIANDLGSGLVVSSFTQPAHGTVVIQPDGTFTFTPTPGYSGPDAFTYTVTDAAGHSSTTTVSVTVTPVTTNDAVSTLTNTPITAPSLLANDSGTGLTVTANTVPAHGTVFINPDGTYTYTPASGYSGPDSFTYTATDNRGRTSTATVSITVGNVSVNDAVTLSTGQSAVVAVLSNDSGSGLTITSVSNPAHGSVALNPDGTITYTSTAGTSGTDSFTYTATDASGHMSVATVTVDVLPAGQNVVSTTVIGTRVTIDIVGADQGSVLANTLTIVRPPSHGTVSVGVDGTVVYTPEVGYTGLDTFDTDALDAAGHHVKQTITVTVRGRATLPRTGGNSAPLVDLAGLLVAAGGALTIADRRRRRRGNRPSPK